MWDVIRAQVREGATLLLTTQYLEEADELATEIAVVDKGKIIARGTADELKSQVGGERIEVVIHEPAELRAGSTAARARQLRDGRGAHAPDHDRRRRGCHAARRRRPRLGEAGIKIDDIGLRRPTLDDVFLELTGHAAEELPDEEEAAA